MNSPDVSRLCELYLRDVITFLLREEIVGACRFVSQHLNSTFLNCPEPRLPRCRFGGAMLEFRRSRIKVSRLAKPLSLPEDCCHELKVI